MTGSAIKLSAGIARRRLAREAARLNARNGPGLPSLVLMTDERCGSGWSEAVSALPRGSAVIVRARDAGTREALARELAPVCATRGVKLLIAADAALAFRLRADGVHLPQAEMRRLAGIRRRNPGWLITVAAHDMSAATGARLADGVLVAPVFDTASHPEKEGIGVVRFAALARLAKGRCYALGGVSAETAGRLRASPAAGVALVSGWLSR